MTSLGLPLAASLLATVGVTALVLVALGTAVAGILLFRRAQSPAASGADHLADMIRAHGDRIGDRIETLVGQQQLQAETQRQALAQSLDGIGQAIGEQRHQVDGLRNELRHEVRRRDAEIDEIRSQIVSIQAVQGGLGAAPSPRALAAPAESAPDAEQTEPTTDPAPSWQEPSEEPVHMAPTEFDTVDDLPGLRHNSGDGAATSPLDGFGPAGSQPASEPAGTSGDLPSFFPPASFDAPSFETASVDPASSGTSSDDVTSFEPASFEPASFDAALLAPVSFESASFGTPAPDPPFDSVPAGPEAAPFTPSGWPSSASAPSAEPPRSPSESADEATALDPPSRDQPNAVGPPTAWAAAWPPAAEASPALPRFESAAEPVAAAEGPTGFEVPGFALPAFGPPSASIPPPSTVPAFGARAGAPQSPPPDTAWIARADAAEPTAPAAAEPPAAPPLSADTLTALPGLNEAVQQKLYRAGVTTLEAIAGWSPSEAKSYAAHVGVSEEVSSKWIWDAQTALFQNSSTGRF